MTSKQSELINKYKSKITNTKFVLETDSSLNQNTIQTKKTFYSRSLQLFIETHFGNGNHFGDMNNNFQKVISYLDLNDVIGFKLKVPAFSKKNLNINTSKTTSFEDFDANSIFESTLFAKEGIDYETFLKAIEKIDDKFIIKNDTIIKEEINKLNENLKKEKKKTQKKEYILYSVFGIAIIVSAFVYMKFLK